MANSRDLNVVAEIKRRYGHVIDLDKSPMAIIEIIHNFRHLLDEVAGPDGTGGGPPGPPPPPPLSPLPSRSERRLLRCRCGKRCASGGRG